MSPARFLALLLSASLPLCLPAAATNLVSGNGFGFATVAPETATVTSFFAHPYSYARPDAKNPLGEGVETTSFIKSLRWAGGASQPATAEFEADSHVLHARSGGGEGFYFTPFGLHRAALVITWEPGFPAAAQGSFTVEWSHPVRSQRAVLMPGFEMQVLRFEGIQESLLLIPLSKNRPAPAGNRGVLATNLAWALVSLESDDDFEQTLKEFNTWRASLAPAALVKRELAELEQWRIQPAVQFASEKERHLWRQSEVMLRMAQSRESNRPGRNGNGLIVACLPDGAFFTPWVRDMAYAALALVRMGHRDEARAALLAYFNAQPTGQMRAQTGGADYQVSVVRYFGDGSEEPFFTQEGSTNIEYDNWGEVLWLLGEYVQKFNDPTLLAAATHRGKLYESARDFVAKPLLANLEGYGPGSIVTADTSIWEERQKDKKHFAFSTAMAIVGLTHFAETARRAGDEATRKDVLARVAQLRKGFNAAFIRGGKLHGTLEEGVKNDIDGALLPVINLGVVTDPAVIADTITRMEMLKVASGGYRRVRCILTDQSIYEYWYEREEFLFVDLSLAELERRIGKRAEADAMLQRIVDKAAADHNIIPEMYVALDCKLFHGALGDPTGATPMVGYGAGAYILHLLERAAVETPR